MSVFMVVVVGVVLLIACAALAVYKSSVEAQQRRVFGGQRPPIRSSGEDSNASGRDGGAN
ncbi:MAG: hypothetical protein ABI414_08080 [Devosia sp.]